MVNEDPKCVSEPLRLCWLNNPAGNVLAAPAGKILFYGVLAKIQDFFFYAACEKKTFFTPQKKSVGAMSSSVFCLLDWCQACICSASFSCCCLCVMLKVALETRTFVSALFFLFLFLCQTSPENKRRRRHRTYLWGRKD